MIQPASHERSIGTSAHGRYLVRPAAIRPAPMLVGFHGYAESADMQFERLGAIPGADRWCLVSIQALHRFYRARTNDVVASWMTRQDRELAIADNIAYVMAVVDEVAAEYDAGAPLVFAGFSQGVAMAFRAAVRMAKRPVMVVAVGGDVPPELGPDALRNLSACLVCRGARDRLYSAEQFEGDIARLTQAGLRVQRTEFEGGHEWPADAIAIARFLRRD